jgi:hypothetical protein
MSILQPILTPLTKAILEGLYGDSESSGLVFHALTYDTDSYQMLGVKTGTGDLTEARTGDAVAYTTDGTNTWTQTIGANEPNWHMARRVENLLSYSEDFSNAAWSKSDASLTSGIADPEGGTDAYTFTADAGAAYVRRSTPSGYVGKTVIATCWVRRRTGTGEILMLNGNDATAIEGIITSSWQRISAGPVVPDNAGDRVGFSITTSGDEIDIFGFQFEDTTGRSDTTTPSEYCPTQAATGSNLVTNGTFDSDTDWVKGVGWSISGGTASCDGTQTGTSSLSQAAGVIAGATYKCTFTISNYSAGQARINNSGAGPWRSSNGTYTAYLTATANIFIYIQGDADFVGDIDNVEVYDTTTGVRVFKWKFRRRK